MTVNELFAAIAQQKPPVIYISGKTSTGKSTFGRRLRDELGYQVIELEAVLMKVIREHGLDEQSTFRAVMYDAADSPPKGHFIAATDNLISEALAEGKLLAIEGAVANADTLKRILEPAHGLRFVYFHPTDIEVYIRNLTSRFMQSGEDSYGGLPLKFWRLIDDTEFKTFCQTRELTAGLRHAIREYAAASQKESLSRLEEFRRSFDGITLVEIS
jgi:adenylate kinase family enzyme